MSEEDEDDQTATVLSGNELPRSAAKDKTLSPAAVRALREAEARRAEIDRKTSERPMEKLGREGPDPARYGDWENKGIASDF
jgi:hypothetical protein